MEFAPLFAYCLALFVAAVIPGPGIAALVGQALGGGSRNSMFFILGIALRDLTWLTVAVVGLAAVAKTFAEAFLVIKIMGAVYLLYLGWVFWTADVSETRIRTTKEGTALSSVFAAYMVTLGNPKSIIFYLALLPSVVDLDRVDLVQWLILAVLTTAVLFAVLIPYAMLAAKARAVMSDTSALRKLNQVAAGVIGAAGALILAEATAAFFRRA
ncbi:LysE family translocator [Halocynthiibacter styelae]|uniref:LysE family translocator n=1 Tax=Halocynthiibacter styelae TaxID=2761955 RepID=A0A8J7LK09_9RHOB|nr:LysE family translocator [Paenihalocynthiibacter styelae]MBI1492950.1 LysE family translocator [Paenihalocynthiibacter styelae]